MGEKFNLTWHTFSSHGKELFKNLMETQEFTDITLISDDHHQYKVHKFILSACSSAFREILTNNSLNSSIYLRGIQHEELESILQYIYLGEATFYHQRMNEFLNVAKNLDIKEIGKNVIDEIEENEVETQNFEKLDHARSDENHYISDLSSNITSQEIKASSYSLNRGDMKPYKCLQCDYQAANKGNFTNHVQTKHDDIKYPCQKCSFQTNSTASLQRHMKIVHEGIRYQCQQCDFQAVQTCALKKHIQSIHEGIRYQCQQCEYEATQTENLQKHIKAIHEGIKYPCQHCDYQATATSSLRRHVKSKH